MARPHLLAQRPPRATRLLCCAPRCLASDRGIVSEHGALCIALRRIITLISHQLLCHALSFAPAHGARCFYTSAQHTRSRRARNCSARNCSAAQLQRGAIAGDGGPDAAAQPVPPHRVRRGDAGAGGGRRCHAGRGAGRERAVVPDGAAGGGLRERVRDGVVGGALRSARAHAPTHPHPHPHPHTHTHTHTQTLTPTHTPTPTHTHPHLSP